MDQASPNSSAKELWLQKPLRWRANLACLMQPVRTWSEGSLAAKAITLDG
ncbi:hypothetical protein NDI39_03955 [Microcoleus sp. ZQ-A2]|nr:hypothetical protein [Microcoleus sp. FACHB-1]